MILLYQIIWFFVFFFQAIYKIYGFLYSVLIVYLNSPIIDIIISNHLILMFKQSIKYMVFCYIVF